MTLAFEDFAGASGGSSSEEEPAEADTSDAAGSGAVTSKTSKAAGGSATASGSAAKASSTQTASKDAGSESLVEGSSCKIAKDSPYAAYSDFFVCNSANRSNGSLGSAMLLMLGIAMILL